MMDKMEDKSMSHKKIAGVLKVFSVITAVIGGFFFFFYVPQIIKEIALQNPETDQLIIPGIGGMWVIAGLCYIALWNFWKLCTEIGKDNSFSIRNAGYMKNIGLLSSTAIVLFFLGGLFIFLIHFLNAAWFFIIFFLCFISAGVAVLSFALSALIKNAMEIKEENDLTI